MCTDSDRRVCVTKLLLIVSFVSVHMGDTENRKQVTHQPRSRHVM